MAILLDQYAETRLEAIRTKAQRQQGRLVHQLMNEVITALWTMPEARGKTIKLQHGVAKLEVTRKSLTSLQRLIEDLANAGYAMGDEISVWVGSFRNAIQINLGSEYLPPDGDSEAVMVDGT